MKSSTTNVETSINEEVFHEVSESFQWETSSSSLNNDVQQSPEEVILPQTNTQSYSINMIPNGDEATFLNGILKEEVYVGQPLGFVSKQYPDHVYALDKALYDLKQAPRARMENCDTFLTPMVEQVKLKLDLVGKPVDHTDYQSMIGSLMYVTSSRPDIMFATCLWYPKDFGFDLTACSDADHAGCHLDQKSTSGSVQFLGDKLVCWSSKKQNCVSISTAESEYVTVSSCCAQVLWMRTQLIDYDFFNDKVPIYCDSKSAIAISCNPVQHTCIKHIDVRSIPVLKEKKVYASVHLSLKKKRSLL
nr:hypothetical protein [Tanacetum cinerariifolium]